jgi:E3 ubiquitin-protein ligase RGLG
VQEVQQALGASGLESSNLIVGIDFTKSNEWTGKHSFGSRSLHAIGSEPNPYEKAIAIIGKTLSTFDDDNLIPCFGFGDSTTHDKHVFSFNSDHRPCDGFEEALLRYRTIVPHLRLAGPTSFAPIINAAVDIVEESGGQYHVLIIIADGQVTRSVDVADGQQSPQEQATVEAIVNASSYPLSIVLVGVGDGPWDTMKEFDDNLPHRSFDNFQFVNFTQIMQQNLQPQRKEASFALAALMEIPEQYKATLELGMLSKTVGRSPGIKPLLPPPKVLQRDGYQQPRSGYQPPGYQPPGYPQQPAYQQKPSFNNGGSQNYSRPRDPYQQPGYGGGYDYNYNYSSPPSAPTITRAPDEPITDCPVCLTDKKDLAFNCGHQTCRQCADSLQACPICREPITTRIRLY